MRAPGDLPSSQERIDALVAAAPPLTQEQRERLEQLLSAEPEAGDGST